MRRSYTLVLLGLSFGIVPCLVHACSTETGFESVCDGVADPTNCYREFRAGMLGDDGGPSTLRPGCTFAEPQPTQVNDRAHPPTGLSNGTFQTRPMLAPCIIDSGDSVALDPPINLAAWPPSLDSTPITYTITLADAFGVTCDTATYTSPHGFAISIAGTGGGGFTFLDAGDDGSDGGFQATPAFGTYTQTIAPGSDAFDVTCPSGETHQFNLDESGDAVQSFTPNTSECPRYASLVPSASLQIDAGGVNRAGAVSFAIVYPNTTATYPRSSRSATPTASTRTRRTSRRRRPSTSTVRFPSRLLMLHGGAGVPVERLHVPLGRGCRVPRRRLIMKRPMVAGTMP